MASVARETYTPEEYLALEREAEHRSQFIDGKILPMQHSSLAHLEVTGNLLGEIHQQLKETPCRVYSMALRVKVSATSMYTYPDIAATCDKAQLEDNWRDTLLNPVLIAEVLSPATEAYDRGVKFTNYRKIPSLQEYVLVAQDKIHVERYIRQGEDWILSEFDEPTATLHLSSIGCSILISEIYADVDFPVESLSSTEF